MLRIGSKLATQYNLLGVVEKYISLGTAPQNISVKIKKRFFFSLPCLVENSRKYNFYAVPIENRM